MHLQDQSMQKKIKLNLKKETLVTDLVKLGGCKVERWWGIVWPHLNIDGMGPECERNAPQSDEALSPDRSERLEVRWMDGQPASLPCSKSKWLLDDICISYLTANINLFYYQNHNLTKHFLLIDPSFLNSAGWMDSWPPFPAPNRNDC